MSLGKTGLVLDGGGAKCVFQIGALLAFEERGIKFSKVQGVSAGCLNGAKFVESGAQNLKKIWMDLDKRGYQSLFGSWFFMVRHSFSNALYNDAELNQLVNQWVDVNGLLDSETEFELVVRNELTEKIEIFNTRRFKEESGNPEVFRRLIKASASLPGGFSPENINGQLYSDGCEFDLDSFADFDTVFFVNSDQPLEKVDPDKMAKTLANMHFSIRTLKLASALIDRIAAEKIKNFVLMNHVRLVEPDEKAAIFPIINRIAKFVENLIGPSEKRLIPISPSINIPTLRLDYWGPGDFVKSIENGYQQTTDILDRLGS
ncbi:MAG: hypothetical protein A3I24_00555 [Candidatus Harrisonbacteria bacterium RIFCSPLOWO2_02_FULL_41_13b]|uniref:PNPLA domain-containing protein n=1 Tax=Candidatus Harrisonbacteria bacterium RIFCSPLOWO2_02_FULL_41_13b TaxID=1798409 RepID=A0A1G1ZT04_9BACT|nr:MAG: hypothetical protein A3J53_01290 [Candidatus Harrisonbacteria bacterium RIFCSPHIGHO2_02_FULL_40_20]OGY66957.1 MAG: hypothetical protein A3I24_00555 [Candidatus Harrisonbacteria bacterium RIFCSPLOWO2_02_FULL_41_13b]